MSRPTAQPRCGTLRQPPSRDGIDAPWESHDDVRYCVSSQVGCAMGYSFCATGTMGIVGDLSAGEIVEQLLHSRRLERADRYGVAAGAAKGRQGRRRTRSRQMRLSRRPPAPPCVGPTASTADASIEAATEAATTPRSPLLPLPPSPTRRGGSGLAVRRGGGGGGSASGVRNVVFMGMGEPLNNYRAVCADVRRLIDPSLFGIRPSCVTVSTVGIVPQMARFAIDLPGVFCSHSRCMRPYSRCARPSCPPRAPPRSLAYNGSSGRTYVPTRPRARWLWSSTFCCGGSTTGPRGRAAALAALLSPHSDRLMVNITPYNPTDATPEYRRSTSAATATFMTTMCGRRGCSR